MGPPPDLQLPRPAGWPPWAIVASVAIHLAAFAILLVLFVPPGPRGGRHLLVSLLPPVSAPPRVRIAMPVSGEASRSRSRGVPPTDRAPTAVPPSPFPQAGPAVPADSASGWPPYSAGPVTTWRSLGSGVLWDPRVVAPSVARRTHAELTDSAVKAIFNRYLDSLAALPGGGRVLPPSWKATIGGREYGIDGQWITVAGVRIPSLILALIPFPNGGNESKALDVQGRMRVEDYQLALPHAAAAADRREQVKAIRERNAGEKKVREQQRAAPGEATAE